MFFSFLIYPSITSMLLLAGILIVLYIAAASVSVLFDWRKARRVRLDLAGPEA